MTSTVHDDLGLRDLTPAEVLAAVATARRAADREEARLLALAVHWVDLHPLTDPTTGPTAVPITALGAVPAEGTGAGTTLGGDGTPGIAEHALEALAATLDLSHSATHRLVGEAVELCFRLPRLWDLVHAAGCRPGRPAGSPTRPPPCPGPPSTSWTGTSPSSPPATAR